MDKLEEIMRNVAVKAPLVHFITNYVTVNDCANMCLAYNGSPVMSDDIDEVEDIVSLCSALLINIGTLNNRTTHSMLTAGRRANCLDRPVIFDPVGAGSSALRNKTVRLFLRELEFSVIKGNISEIKNLFGGFRDTKGVDAAQADLVTDRNLDESIRFARELSMMSGAVIVITGPLDIISTSLKTYVCRNGCPLMSRVTGTGCMLGGVIAGFVGANPGNVLAATAAAVAAMGVCGELAYQNMEQQHAGSSTFRGLLIDSMSRLDAQMLRKHIRLETR